jgi:hypothetical protein
MDTWSLSAKEVASGLYHLRDLGRKHVNAYLSKGDNNGGGMQPSPPSSASNTLVGATGVEDELGPSGAVPRAEATASGPPGAGTGE